MIHLNIQAQLLFECIFVSIDFDRKFYVAWQCKKNKMFFIEKSDTFRYIVYSNFFNYFKSTFEINKEKEKKL